MTGLTKVIFLLERFGIVPIWLLLLLEVLIHMTFEHNYGILISDIHCPGGSEWIISIGDSVDNSFAALGSSDPREVRLKLKLGFYVFHPFCFLLTVFITLFPCLIKYYHIMFINIVPPRPALLLSMFMHLLSSSLSLSYFILAVLMRKCLGKHTCA